jgi:pyruvate dehydrogenase E2 component (dihydrolipoamide acetyltransferase)
VSPAPEFINGLIAAKTRREMNSVLRLLLAHECRPSLAMVNDLLRYKRLDGAEPALRKFAGFMTEEERSASDALAGVNSPVHVLWGAGDRIIRPLAANALSTRHRFTVLEGTGHMPHIEKSTEVVGAIEAAVESAEQGAHDATQK